MFLYNLSYIIFNMNPTQENIGEKMYNGREEFLCRLLDVGGKCLENESLAFQKKSFCYLKED